MSNSGAKRLIWVDVPARKLILSSVGGQEEEEGMDEGSERGNSGVRERIGVKNKYI
jgi:hypothetical protein